MTSPAVGSTRRRIARPSVDLPQPDSPTRPSVLPDSILIVTPSTAFTTRLTGLPQTILSQTVPPPRSKWTFRFRILIRGLLILISDHSSANGQRPKAKDQRPKTDHLPFTCVCCDS